MRQILKERDNSIEALSKRQPEDSNDSNEMEIDNPFMVQTKDISDVKTIRQCAEKPRNTTFDTFLELRKKLRRSIFREDEVIIQEEITQMHIACVLSCCL